MEDLPRYPFSLILTLLGEVDGTRLLITRKARFGAFLRIYERRQEDSQQELRVLSAGPTPKRRHTFLPFPVQDPDTLLDRVNTKRLYRRKRHQQRAPGSGDSRVMFPELPPNKTTDEVATSEWQRQPKHPSESECFTSNCIPPHLELGRFRAGPADEFWNDGPIALVSYPRSGNTLVRTLLERVTGIITGSDTRPDRTLSRELSEQHELVGEGLVNHRKVVFLKSHWPERVGTLPIRASRFIVLVRNPYDAIDSYWNMNATCTHTSSVDESVYARFADKIDRLHRNEIRMWMEFLKYWLSPPPSASSSGIAPKSLVVRMEDLMRDPEHELFRIMRFSLRSGEVSDFWKARIQHVTGSRRATKTTTVGDRLAGLGSYKPRAATKGTASIGKSLHRFSKFTLSFMHDHCDANYNVNYLQKLGYSVDDVNGFPRNFTNGNPPLIDDAQHEVDPKPSSVTINQGCLIRPISCEFGRKLQQWRHSVTNDDAEPLPTKPKLSVRATPIV